MPTTRSGRSATRAIAVIGIDEVFEASTQSPETISRDKVENSSCLSSRRSGAASITMSQSSSAASSPAVCKREASTSRPLAAQRSRPARSLSVPAARASGMGSTRNVSAPAPSASCAIPAPIVPAPMTPTIIRTGRGR